MDLNDLCNEIVRINDKVTKYNCEKENSQKVVNELCRIHQTNFSIEVKPEYVICTLL